MWYTQSKALALDSFINNEGHSISSKGFLPIVVDIMVIWLNSPIPNHFSSLIPKMLMFTLAIYCLSTSNLLWTVALEKTLENPLDSMEIKPVNPKGNQSWIIIGRTDAEAEAPILWPSDVNNWLIGKDPDAGKDWGQKKGTTEDEMFGWQCRLNGHEFQQVPGVGDGQGGLACCNPWSCKESDTTEWLNWTELNWIHLDSWT